MQLAASRPLLDGGIKVNPASSVTLYANVHIGLTGEGICIVNIRTAAWVFIPNAVMPYSSKPVVVKAVIWEQERLFSRFKFDAATNIRDTVQGMVDQFVTKWKLANQK